MDGWENFTLKYMYSKLPKSTTISNNFANTSYINLLAIILNSVFLYINQLPPSNSRCLYSGVVFDVFVYLQSRRETIRRIIRNVVKILKITIVTISILFIEKQPGEERFVLERLYICEDQPLKICE